MNHILSSLYIFPSPTKKRYPEAFRRRTWWWVSEEWTRTHNSTEDQWTTCVCLPSQSEKSPWKVKKKLITRMISSTECIESSIIIISVCFWTSVFDCVFDELFTTFEQFQNYLLSSLEFLHSSIFESRSVHCTFWMKQILYRCLECSLDVNSRMMCLRNFTS